MPYAIVTRDHAGAEPYAAALAPLGLEVIAMPVTSHAAPRDPDAVRRAVIAGGFTAVIVASVRAAAALVEVGLPLPEVWAIGPATARVMRGAGLGPVFEPAVRDVAELAFHVVRARAGGTGGPVLVPRAEDGREEGIAILRAANIEVIDVVAYRTLAVARDDPSIATGLDLLVRGECAVCAVFAPSQVVALDAVTSVAKLATILVAFGDTTRAALEAAGGQGVIVASQPTPEGVAKAVRAVYPRR